MVCHSDVGETEGLDLKEQSKRWGSAVSLSDFLVRVAQRLPGNIKTNL